MTLQTFLAELRRRDIQVWVDGERLRCSAPTGELTPELRGELQQHKSDLVDFLRSTTARVQQQRAIVPLQPRGTRAPIFAVGGHNGDVFCYRELAQELGADQPLYGLEPPGLDGRSGPLERVEDLAAHFAAQIRAFGDGGPYVIAGYCAGGVIAFELARQLLQQRTAVSFVALFGAPHPARYRRLAFLRERIARESARALGHLRALAAPPAAGRRAYIAHKLRAHRARRAAERDAARDPVLVRRARVERATVAAARRYRPGYFAGRLCLVLPCAAWTRSADQPLRWRGAAARVEEYFGADGCDIDRMLRAPYVGEIAALFRRCGERGGPG